MDKDAKDENRSGNPIKDAYRLSELKELGGPGRTKAYELVASGKLRAKKAGRNTIVTREDWLKHLAELPEVPPRTEERK